MSNGSSGEFVYKNGRRYHGVSDAPYPLPNDVTEMDRYTKEIPCSANNPQNILDIGTGTGVWLMDVATDFPNCSFLGVDIAPLQPQTVLPSNCRFELQNILDGLAYADNTFDFVRHRMLVGAIPRDCWNAYVKDCIRMTTLGGWIEMADMNGLIVDDGPCATRLARYFNRAVQPRNIELSMIENTCQLMRDNGLENIRTDCYAIPLGEWAGDLGRMAWNNLRQGILAMKPLIVTTSNVTPETVDEFVVKLEQEINERQSCCQLWVHVGQKLS
ncbi:S-adenosyl-L-methionine-dependent methyltransferase [Syncephalis plumigaleata]|nr:S-adenosyl-L-methionine-dependent methyltransferase [Syncephalis plumigaleata]